MKGVMDLLPIAIGVAVVGAITWFLLDRDIGVGTWLLATLLFAHGWVHLMFVFPTPTPAAATATAGGLAYPFDMGRSWLATGHGLDAGTIRTIGMAVMALTFVGFALAAMATLGWLVPAAWWDGLVIGSALGSTILLVLFFSPGLLLGFVINAGLVWLVLASIWSPMTAGLPGAV
jgi:hypothetical protein